MLPVVYDVRRASRSRGEVEVQAVEELLLGKFDVGVLIMDVELQYRRSSLRKLCGRAGRRVSDQTQKAMGACSALRHCGTKGEVIHIR